MEVLDLFLEPIYPYHHMGLVNGLNNIPNTDVFDRVLALCKEHLKADWQLRPGERLDQLLPVFLWDRFRTATQRGELAMMKHLVQIGLKPHDHEISTDDQGSYSIALITEAGKGGHTDTLIYLLEMGLKIGSHSLEAASKHGNPECVRVLLEYGATDDFQPGNAVLESMLRENDAVLQILIKSGMMRDNELVLKAVETAKDRELNP